MRRKLSALMGFLALSAVAVPAYAKHRKHHHHHHHQRHQQPPPQQQKQQQPSMQFQPDAIQTKSATPPESTRPPSKTLERATKLYDKGDYYSASIEFYKVLHGQTNDDAAAKQRAQFFMGKTLYQMGYYAASLAKFDKIVKMGHAHKYFDATLKWLAALSRVLPETSGILDKIGQYNPSALDQPILRSVRDELYFLLGRHYYRKANFDQAIALFEKVNPKSPYYLEAKFFEGVTYVREYKGRPAVDAFKAILRVGADRPSYLSGALIDKFQELARLQMARIFYSTRQYNLSIKYYEMLPQDSPDWLESLFEASWAYFMKANASKALGNIQTLNAPYFENEFFPESILLQAVIYYKYCLYQQALEAVSNYDRNYRPLRQDIKQLLAKYDDNTEFYKYIKKIQSGEAGLPPRTERLVMSAIGDKTLEKTFHWVDELGHELKSLSHAEKSWQTTEVAANVLQELTLQKSLAEADAGRLARERIQDLAGQLKELSRDGLKIKIEVLNAKAGQISAKMKGEMVHGHHNAEKIIVDDEHFLWKFNGEYWKDELGFYRFKIASKCPESGDAAVQH